jgi:hypothetical protein
MTSLTKLIEMIEYHSNTLVTNIINSDPNFNPNSILRSKHSLASTAVTYNNFEIFKLVVNHNKFDINAKLNWGYDYPNKILKRVSMCDIYENRRFLDELYNLNFKFTSDHLLCIDGENETLFNEIFEKIDKTYPTLKTILHRFTYNTKKFKIVFDYIKEHFNDNFTKQECDSFLKDALVGDQIGIVTIIKNGGFDITVCNNKNSILYVLSAYSKNNLVLSYLVTLEGIFYKGNLIEDLFQFSGINPILNNMEYYQLYKCCISIEYLLSNYEIIKPIYEKIEDYNNFMLKFIINSFWNKNFYHRTMFTHYGSLIKYLMKHNIIKIEATTTLDKDIIKNIVTNLQVPTNGYKDSLKMNLRSLITQLMYHGFKPNNDLSELMKLIYKEDELKDMDEFVKKNAYFEVVKRPKKANIKKKANEIVL